MRKLTSLFTAVLCCTYVACTTDAPEKEALVQKIEDPAKALTNAATVRANTPVQVADGLELTLWASDSLAPDPVSLAVDDQGRMYITRTNRQKNSEFDIRGHRDWMTASISFKTVEERRAFLRKTFAPEKSKENEWLPDLNKDGSHDWKDLGVQQDEVWRVEDSNGDGVADRSTRVFAMRGDEVTDVAGGLLVSGKEAYYPIAPDLWKLSDTNNDGVWDKKTSLSHGYQVHIGFGGHGMSGVVEGPDGRLYWNIGDIGAYITAPDGKVWDNANSGFIARANPDGTDFEIFATGLRNTHEFVFDDYGNLISSDNDGDHPGEMERLVHVVEGSDAGWRTNWQYGKYTDPNNNSYNVWMDEKLSVPHWEGQAAYIMPPIMNYHNGPTGMLYNPGTALGKAWQKKFFVVEFVGTPNQSHIWSFGLKPKGASFVLDGEKDVLSGVLPTGIQFGPDGALYLADWINGWSTKDQGRIWKLDVTKDKNDLAKERAATKEWIQMDYDKAPLEKLYQGLMYMDQRVRQKAQFELVRRGEQGQVLLMKAARQKDLQLGRIHGLWGLGQLARKQSKLGAELMPFLKDADEEIVVQAIRMLSDARYAAAAPALMPLLESKNPRIAFFAAEGLGKLKHVPAIAPLLALLQRNNDQDLYLRHAATLALSRIGKPEPLLALSKNPSKAMRTAAVMVLRRMAHPGIAAFLQDQEEYLVTEAARAINDDHSIPAALPALAALLEQPRFSGEPLMRRAINAALRTGSDKSLNALIQYALNNKVPEILRAEAIAALGTWAEPSVLDRVDGRYRGTVKRDAGKIKQQLLPHLDALLAAKNPNILIAACGLLVNLKISEKNQALADLFKSNATPKIRAAVLPALQSLKYAGLEPVVKQAMADGAEEVRTAALGLLNDQLVTKENLPQLSQLVFQKGSVKEQQQLLVAMSRLTPEKTQSVLENLVKEYASGKIQQHVALELKEAIDSCGSPALKNQWTALLQKEEGLGKYADALYGGDGGSGWGIFNYNSTAQCVRCHRVGGNGGQVGPALDHIATTLSRTDLLKALIHPDARIAPGYGNVTVTLDNGASHTGTLLKEDANQLTLKTADAEPLVLPVKRIKSRKNLPSGMPPIGLSLKKRELRDVVEYLSSLK